VSLRTYPLIVHPAFISFVEYELGRDAGMHQLPASLTPIHLPSIHDVHDIATYLKVSPFLFRSMLQRPERHYRRFAFNKRSGGKRWIHSPRTFLKVTQWWILDTILQNCSVSPFAHGFVKGRSFLTNAQAHFGAVHVANFDVADFFPSLSSHLVAKVFRGLGYSERVSIDLARLTTLEGSLPQGAPTSPTIANLIFNEVDEEIAHFAAKLDLTYTRYADDLTLSSKSRINPKVEMELARLLAPLGLQLNTSKTRYMGPNERKEVTGLVLGLNDVRLSPEFLNACRGWFYTAARHPAEFASHEDKIRGTLALINQIKGAGSSKVAELGRAALKAIELRTSISPAAPVDRMALDESKETLRQELEASLSIAPADSTRDQSSAVRRIVGSLRKLLMGGSD
jgi:retron-type reverse transcriptase